MSDETMQPPPCADHGYNRLECPECGDARRIHYEKLAATLSATEPDDEVVPHVSPSSELLLDFGGESTSARLRRVEQERDAIHEGLVAARRELSAATERAAQAEGERDIAQAELASARAELTTQRYDLGHFRHAVAQLRADLTAASDELEQLRAALQNPTTQGDLP